RNRPNRCRDSDASAHVRGSVHGDRHGAGGQSADGRPDGNDPDRDAVRDGRGHPGSHRGRERERGSQRGAATRLRPPSPSNGSNGSTWSCSFRIVFVTWWALSGTNPALNRLWYKACSKDTQRGGECDGERVFRCSGVQAFRPRTLNTDPSQEVEMLDMKQATAQYEAWLGERLTIVKADLAKKHLDMAADPFIFLRATFYRWAQVFPKVCSD